MSYEDLPYDELRDKAFALAEHRHDVSFFYDLYRHTPAMTAMAAEGGSLGETSGSLIEIVKAAREAFGSGTRRSETSSRCSSRATPRTCGPTKGKPRSAVS